MAQTPVLTPRVRSTAAPPQPLLPVGGGASRAAAAVASELERVLASHADDAATLAACAAREAPSGAVNATSTVAAVLDTVAKLQRRATAFLEASSECAGRGEPSAAALADEALTCLDKKLDALESRLAILYDLPNVVVPPPTEEATPQAVAPCLGIPLGAPTIGSATPRASSTPFSCRPAGTPAMLDARLNSTPKQAARLSPPTPSTPNMHDFGIDDAALEGLSAPLLYHLGSAKKPLPQNAPYEDVVQRSMDALHIEENTKALSSFGKKDDELATPPLPPTPPNVDLPPLFPMLESKPVPAPSAVTPPQPKSPSRALSFDTPDTAVPERRVTRSQTKRSLAQTIRRETRATVTERIHSDEGSFFTRRFDESAIFQACDLLHSAHEAQGTSTPLTMTSEDLALKLQSLSVVSGPQDAMMLLYTLSKLGVLHLEIANTHGSASSYSFGRRR